MNDRELIALREYGFNTHRGWKTRSRLSDQILQGDWQTVFPDMSVSHKEPLVENVYTEALYDKAASAASVTPQVEVAPVRGTREDRAESQAQKRRRAFRTFLLTVTDEQVGWAMDWLQHGAMFGMPWKLWRDPEGQGRYPFGVRLDPRWAFPLSHNSRGDLTQAFFLRYQPLHELERDYGFDNDALGRLRAWSKGKGRQEVRTVETIWYVDETSWGMAVVASPNPTPDMWRYTDPLGFSAGDMFSDWVIPKHPHRLSRCPIVEKRRLTADGEYRGALDDMIPNLRVAQNIMARLMDMIDIQTGVPIGLDNVSNPEDFVPGGILRGTGEGDMRIIIPQFPVNFEAITHARGEIDAARNVGAYPQQRSGEHGASIASGKAAGAVMGAFNVQLAWNQRDLAVFYRDLLSRMAEFDEVWCPGRKEITGWDEGELYSDSYDPASFWKQDYRNEITFNRVGLEEHNFITRLGLFKQMGAISARTMMRKSGLIDNPLQEEREQDLEKVKEAFFGLVAQQALLGNADPLYRYAQKIDADNATTRQAVFDTIREMRLVAADGGVQPPGGPPGGGRADSAMLMERSLDAGGVPGSAEGLPPPRVGGALAGMLPPGMGRALESVGG